VPYARYENLWERLLLFLDEWSAARELQPGRISVEFSHAGGTTRVIEVLMTEDEWDDMVSVPWGGFGPELQQYLKDRVLGLRLDERFLIYSQYDVVPSTGATLPGDPEEERMTQLARRHPEGFGRWSTTDKHGKVIEYEPPPDPGQEPADDPTGVPRGCS
jgi:hypothetical protein